MTIAVAIRTGSAVVFAADSKLTTRGIAGLKDDGKPRWVTQTYDNATKVISDRGGTVMAMFGGNANIGEISVIDHFSRLGLPRQADVASQNALVAHIVEQMAELKRAFWSKTKVPPEQWPGPTILLAAPHPDGIHPRVWEVELSGPDSSITETLKSPHLLLVGAYAEVAGLLYGVHHEVITGVSSQIGIAEEKIWDATYDPKVLRPIDKLNFYSMPLQDAVDLAVFLATVQVEMDRFLPGTPACGGPIDVMVLRMAPEAEILAYPGKILHHPKGG